MFFSLISIKVSADVEVVITCADLTLDAIAVHVKNWVMLEGKSGKYK